MSKRTMLVLAALVLALAAPLASWAQQQEPPTFIRVADWTIPRGNWEEYVAFTKKNVQPLFEKLMADGTITGWGFFSTAVHEEDGYTHGSWYSANSIANSEKALAELVKLPQSPIITAGPKHRDYLLRAPLLRTRAASGSNGYLWVSGTLVQPGKGQEWRELWDKYTKPVYDELLANGTIVFYAINVEQVHTLNPGQRWVVYVAPSADAIDKVRAAFEAAGQKRGADANRGIGQAFADVTVAGVHRDFFANVTSYAQK